MGLFDSIGLGSVGKMLDVGGIVKNVVDGVLPKNMAAVGDIAGAIVDFKTGNIAAAVQHGMEAVRDLPQAARGPQPSAANSPTNLNRMPGHLEPLPPPLASRQGKPFDWNELLSAIKALTAALSAQRAPATDATAKPAGGSGTAPTTAATTTASTAATTANATTANATTANATTANATHAATASNPAPAAPSAPAASTPAAGSSPAASAPAAGSPPRSQSTGAVAQDWVRAHTASERHRTDRHTQTEWRGQPQPRPGTSTPAKPTNTTPAATASTPAATASTTPAPVADHPAAATTTPTAAKPATATGTASTPAGSGAGQTISSLSQLNSMSDSAIRDAVINGRISPEIAKDPNAMMVLQQRMNAITEMNNLMTAMMRALHDMQMAVIQNIRI